ncbi:MAG: riboflavin synthase [Candidatus Magasanikbacteria bacterium]|nr:riboflavin synthase [Candidatus Magasanikbacteria bacterium]
MFSGIIKEMGEIVEIKPKAQGFIFVIKELDAASRVEFGASICNSGVCLTVFEKKDGKIFFEVMPETLRKTSLGQKKIGDKVNLETSLKVGDEIGGHFVYGHVDCVGKVENIVAEGDNKLVSIKIPSEWMQYITPEGSVAVDGVSLTVARVEESGFTVSLIEYTLKNTTLGRLKIGDKVNIEFDMLAKYVITANRQPPAANRRC